jgi:hypothetical protein
MNVAAQLIARIEARRAETAKPCKSYSTEAKAEAVAADYAQKLANYFVVADVQQAARYIVVYNAAWGRWVIGFDLTELLSRRTSTGGYVGVASDAGFYTY